MTSLELPQAQGLVLTEAFYWDKNDETRKWTRRFREARRDPSLTGRRLSVDMHDLKAVKAAGTDEAGAVMNKMREMPVNDFWPRTASSARTADWCTTCTSSR